MLAPIFFLIPLLFSFGAADPVDSINADDTPTKETQVIGYNEEGRAIVQVMFLPYERILNWDGEYVDYIITQDETNIYFSNAIYSATINKAANTISIDGDDLSLSHVIKETPDGVDNWQAILTEGNFTTSQTPNSPQIVSIKNDFRTVYDLRYSGIEYTYQYINNDVSKNNHKYGFTTVCDGADCDVKVDGQSIAIGASKNKAELFEIIDEATQQKAQKNIKLGSHNFDLKNDQHDFTWSINKVNSNKVAIDLTHSKGPLLLGETLTVDPTIAFTYTGSDQTWAIPTNTANLVIKAWGGGGAGQAAGQIGGGAGFAQGTLDVTGMTDLKIVVGQGGQNAATAYGGGGSSTSSGNGGGGGYSGVFDGSVAFGNAIIIAGGGGGAVAGGGCGGVLKDGGEGGASTGGTGGGTCGAGVGGSQVAGGAGGAPDGVAGTALTGASSGHFGAGGGGGYYGGGSGRNTGGSGEQGAAGGGSNYVGHASLSGTTSTAGTPSTGAVANSGDPDYPGGVGNGGNGALGQNGYVYFTYDIIPAPDAVDDLSSPSQEFGSVDLLWTEPNLNTGNLSAYEILYDTPQTDNPASSAGNVSTTSATVSNLNIATPYSFKIVVFTEASNSTGNVLNVTTAGNFTIGTAVFNQTNTSILPITFEEQAINSTAKFLNVTYANTFTLECDLSYKFANINQTYSGMTATAVSTTLDEVAFEFVDYENEIISVYCYDTVTGTDGKYLLIQDDFPLLQQIQSFRDGEYGTDGDFGVFDFVTLLVVIISMIGLNRVNESVGAIFNIIFLGGLAFFGIIELPTIVFGFIALVLVFVITSTRKN